MLLSRVGTSPFLAIIHTLDVLYFAYSAIVGQCGNSDLFVLNHGRASFLLCI